MATKEGNSVIAIFPIPETAVRDMSITTLARWVVENFPVIVMLIIGLAYSC